MALLTLILSAAGSRAAPAPSITEFSLPTENAGPIAITTGPDVNLWVAETLANKIARVSPNGVVTEFAVPTTNANLVDLSAGPDQAVWFTEANSRKIGRIAPEGTITEFPLTGTGGPAAVTNGPNGLWFTLPDDRKIGRIITAGVVSTFVITTNSIMLGDIALGPDGALWVTEASIATDAITRLNLANG